MDKIILDNTKRATFRNCKRKYYWNDVEGLKPDTGSTALRYGSTWHAFMEGYYTYIANSGWDQKELGISHAMEYGKAKWDKESAKQTFYPDYRTFEACAQAFLQYISFYAQDEQFIKVIATERKFECPILLETEEEKRLYGDLPPITFTGRLDLQLEMNGAKWLTDFKTTGQPLSIQASRLNKSTQLMGYTFAGRRVLDFSPDGCLVSMHYLSSRKSQKTGEYGSLSIDFVRVPQIYNDGDLREWRKSFLDTTRELCYSYDHSYWPVNFDSCYQFGACAFTKLCDQNRPLDEVNTDGYHVNFWDVLDED